MRTSIQVYGALEKQSKNGNKYWEFTTSNGKATAFEETAKPLLTYGFNTDVEVDWVTTADGKYTNIKAVYGEPNAVTTEFVKPTPTATQTADSLMRAKPEPTVRKLIKQLTVQAENVKELDALCNAFGLTHKIIASQMRVCEGVLFETMWYEVKQ